MDSAYRAPYDVGKDSKIVLLTGAGASAFLGLKTLQNIADSVKISMKGDVGKVIQATWNSVQATSGRSATFEEVLGRLHFYRESAKLLAEDHIFTSTLGTVPTEIKTGHFERMWKNAIIESYKVLLVVS